MIYERGQEAKPPVPFVCVVWKNVRGGKKPRLQQVIVFLAGYLQSCQRIRGKASCYRRFLPAEGFGLLVGLRFENDHSGHARIPLEGAAEFDFPLGIQPSQIFHMLRDNGLGYAVVGFAFLIVMT